MIDYDIHSCGYYCDRPACIEVQRNELRNKLLEKKEWVGLTDDEMFTLWMRSPAETENRFAFAKSIEAKLKEKNA
jgi:hypothetical protein